MKEIDLSQSPRFFIRETMNKRLHACELVFKEKLMTKGLVLVGFTLTSPQHVARRIEYLFLKIKHFKSVI